VFQEQRNEAMLLSELVVAIPIFIVRLSELNEIENGFMTNYTRLNRAIGLPRRFLMRYNQGDQNTLKLLCLEYGADLEKILKLLSTVQEYELKDKRFGVYDALEEIIKHKDGSTDGEK